MYVCMYVTSCTHGALGREVAAMAVAETMHYCTRRLEVRRLRSGGNFKSPACRYMCTYEMYVCICWNEILCMYVYVCMYARMKVRCIEIIWIVWCFYCVDSAEDSRGRLLCRYRRQQSHLEQEGEAQLHAYLLSIPRAHSWCRYGHGYDYRCEKLR